MIFENFSALGNELVPNAIPYAAVNIDIDQECWNNLTHTNLKKSIFKGYLIYYFFKRYFNILLNILFKLKLFFIFNIYHLLTVKSYIILILLYNSKKEI